MEPPPDKQYILNSLAAIARGAGRAPSLSEFLSLSGISEHQVLRFFLNWNDAVRAARLLPHTLNVRLVRRKGKIPSRRAYPHLGQYDPNTCERLWNPSLRTFEGKSSFSTWLTRIAINEALMLRRRTRAQRQVSIDEHFIEAGTGSAGLEIPDSRPDPEVSCAQRERARTLLAATDKLRPALRKAIELRELTELSTEETAGRLGISVGAVKARLFHGRRELREALRRHLRPPRMPRNKAMQGTSIASRGVA